MKTVYKNFSEPIPDLDWSGSQAVCLNDKNEICIVLADDKNYWTLVGGGKEGDETPVQTLVREVSEEAQAEIDMESLEYMLTIWAWDEDDEGNKMESRCKHLQNHRYICKLKNIQEFIPNLGGFEILKRKFVPLKDLHIYLPWVVETENGKEFYEMLKSKLVKI